MVASLFNAILLAVSVPNFLRARMVRSMDGLPEQSEERGHCPGNVWPGQPGPVSA